MLHLVTGINNSKMNSNDKAHELMGIITYRLDFYQIYKKANTYELDMMLDTL